ncbi:MAG: tetratricopeptide repeat protein [Paracoccaceae bacterium]
MRRVILATATVVCLLANPAKAQLGTLIDICGSTDASPREIVNFCQRAIASGQLDSRAQAQVRANLGVGWFELGEYNNAVIEYDKALAEAPDLLGAYLNRARALERLGRLRDAAADYDTVIQRDPRAADAYLGRGAMLLANGDPGRSLDDFSNAIRLQPDWLSPHFNRGMAHFQLGMWREAERDFGTVIQRNPSDAAAFLNRARARARSGDNDAGLDFDRALEIDPEWGGGWFARGQYWESRGNREAANRDFLRAYELGYPDPWLLQRVREISG